MLPSRPHIAPTYASTQPAPRAAPPRAHLPPSARSSAPQHPGAARPGRGGRAGDTAPLGRTAQPRPPPSSPEHPEPPPGAQLSAGGAGGRGAPVPRSPRELPQEDGLGVAAASCCPQWVLAHVQTKGPVTAWEKQAVDGVKDCTCCC